MTQHESRWYSLTWNNSTPDVLISLISVISPISDQDGVEGAGQQILETSILEEGEWEGKHNPKSSVNLKEYTAESPHL